MHSDTFVEAVHARSPELMSEALAPDVRFLSPVVFRPYEGRETVLKVLEAAMNVFEDFTYVHRIEGDGVAALIFQARVGDRDVDGLDLLAFDADGLVGEMKVMVRPLSGITALAERMAEQFDRLGVTAPAGERRAST